MEEMRDKAEAMTEAEMTGKKMAHRKQGRARMVLVLFTVLVMGLLAGCGQKNEDMIESVDQLNQAGYKISVDPGSAAAETAKEWFPEAEIVQNGSASDACLSVSEGKTDAFVYGRSYMKAVLTAGLFDNLAIMDETLDTSQAAVGICPDREELLSPINDFIRQIKEDGTLDDMNDRWYVRGEKEMPEIEKPESPDMTLKVGTYGLMNAMNYLDENQELAGFDIEFIYRMALYLNVDVELETMSYSALVASLESGRLDVVVADLDMTEERKAVILMSDPYSESEITVLVRADSLADSAAGEGTAQKSFLERMSDSFYRTFIQESRWKIIGNGILVTLWLSLISGVLGTLLGFAFSFLLRSKNRWVSGISSGIRIVLGCMPLVVLLLVLYYVVFANGSVSAFWVAITGFTMDFACTTADLLNTGIQAVDRGQIEAAGAMGYNSWQTFCKITMPQAVRQMFGQYQGAVVGLVKGTSIAGYITVEDLTKASDIVRGRTYEELFPLIATAILYFIIAYGSMLLLSKAGVRLDPKRRPRKVKGVTIHD